MFNGVGNSIYLSSLNNGTVSLDDIPDDTPVFLSLHMEEERSAQYVEQMMALCKALNDKKCPILADISSKTLTWFQEKTILDLVRKLNLWAVRIDDGFSTEEMIHVAMEYPIVLNASTVSLTELRILKSYGEILAMHNYYPRKETGLDDEYFTSVNHLLKKEGIPIFAFIPGKQKRGPLFEGLPTLESQRYQNAYVNYLEMVKKYHVDQVFLGDRILDDKDRWMIDTLITKDIIVVPIELDKDYAYLYDTVFSNRMDAPKGLIRIAQSRGYGSIGSQDITPQNTVERERGTLTIDNKLYKRYCGELQITRKGYPKDEKVNVIGKVPKAYQSVLDFIGRGDSFVMVKAQE